MHLYIPEGPGAIFVFLLWMCMLQNLLIYVDSFLFIVYRVRFIGRKESFISLVIIIFFCF